MIYLNTVKITEKQQVVCGIITEAKLNSGINDNINYSIMVSKSFDYKENFIEGRVT